MERAAALTGFAGGTMIAAGYERPRAEGERTATQPARPLPRSVGVWMRLTAAEYLRKVERFMSGGFGLCLTDCHRRLPN